MPAAVSKRYALRLDVQIHWESRVNDWHKANADGYLVAFEAAGDNLHIHSILETIKPIKSLRLSLTRAFPECVGNKGYSLKLCDDDFDAYIRYICKGESRELEPQIWGRCGLLYSPEVVKEAHGMYWVNNASLVANAAKRTKVDSLSIIDQVEKLAKEADLKGYQRKEIAQIYCRLFRDARKGINIFAARAVVNTVSLLLNGDNDDIAIAIAAL